ncbi:MAG: SsrA-binding protein SmpB [Candidatus Omnitrophota bacterium]
MGDIIATNRQARHDYAVFESVEAGIELKGAEVKSLRDGRVSLKDSFARVEQDGIYLYNCHINPYPLSTQQLDPIRPRRLLLHKTQINKLAGLVAQRGFTIVVLKMYFKRGMAKVEIAPAKGKRLYDKREAIKKRDVEREIRRAIHRD